ncbi:MAG: glycosyltransferase [Betaproteobacteria bacterium]|nr:glycosyltransferase [Betaproteobacteria bacterium]
MHFVRRSRRVRPKVSLILLDWSVRESFHLLHYLSLQDVDRESFEVLIVEFYSRTASAIEAHVDQVDTWVLLRMPETCYYHKHLMYNVGIALARGEICVICDSDAMVKPGFIRAIVSRFEEQPDMVLHLDQFRNSRRDLYPFCYPEFDEVTGRGCINYAAGVTRGLADDRDTIHSRNYGACMCARRDDLIAIGGADEHIDYLGHICGPYDMTFRLVNKGLTEVWHPSEFMYHTWHPGQAGENNYLGPHDGRHVSTTALDALRERRVLPLVENGTIRTLRTRPSPTESPDDVSTANAAAWLHALDGDDREGSGSTSTRRIWNGFVVERTANAVVARPLVSEDPSFGADRGVPEFRGESESEVRDAILGSLPWSLRLALPVVDVLTYVSRAMGSCLLFARRRVSRWLGTGGSR